MKATDRGFLDSGGFAASARNDGMGNGQGVDVTENETRDEWTLPDSWVWTTLENCIDVLDGQRVPVNASGRDARIAGRHSSELYPYYGATGQVGWIDDYLFDEELVLLGEDGAPFLQALKDKAYIIRGKSWVNNHAHVLRAIAGLMENSLLCHYLNTADYHDYVTGTTRLKLNQSRMRKISVPLAPLPEQRRIVAAIETQFTRLDAGVAALGRARANLKRYRATVLKAACEGRLVPTEAALARAEGRDYEPADQLLARILAERRARWEAEHPGKRYVESAAPDTGSSSELPEGWTYTAIAPLLSTARAGMRTGPFGSLLKKHEHRTEGVPVLGIENIGSVGYVPGSKIHITEKKAEQLSQYDVQPDDILVSRSGTVGEVCVIPDGVGKARMSTNVMRIVLEPDGMTPKFFWLLFKGSPPVLDQVSELCSGSTRDFLNQTILSSLIFPLPPLAEQRRIVAEVERRLSVVAALEREVEAALARAARLRQSILKRAFEGRLVLQDPNDEPAAVLLERIRAAREALATGGKKRRTRQMPLPMM